MKLPPQMRTLKVIKPHKYGTRHLTAGEEYEVPPQHAIALVASRKARFADKSLKNPALKPVTIAPQAQLEIADAEPIEISAGPDPMDIDSLRMEATQLGIDIDGRWGVPRLQHEIAQAKR